MNRRNLALCRGGESMRVFVLALALCLLSACAAGKPDDPGLIEEPMTRETMDALFTEDVQWWRGYGDPDLVRYLDTALERNVDLAKSAVRIHQALTRAEQAGADLFPTASADGSFSARRSLKTGEVSHSYGVNVLGLSYEVDLWRRLREAKNAAEWEHRATAADRESVRLSLLHSVINGYFNLRYVLEARLLVGQNIRRYRSILDLARTRVNLGKSAPVEAHQAEQSLLAAENQLRGLNADEAALRQTLADLLNCRTEALPPLALDSLLDQKNLPPDLSVPVSALAARPDLMAAEARFAGAFSDLQSARASWYPRLTLNGLFGLSASKSEDILKFPFVNGGIGLSLPFLDWPRVRAQVKLSEDDYELARLDFVNAVTKALNEVWAAYRTSEESARGLALLRERLKHEQSVSAHYEARYRLGAGELKDWLDALNSEDGTRQSVIQAKYQLLRDESVVYRAMGGRFLRKAGAEAPKVSPEKSGRP